MVQAIALCVRTWSMYSSLVESSVRDLTGSALQQAVAVTARNPVARGTRQHARTLARATPPRADRLRAE